MKMRKIFLDMVCFILLIHFFYEGIYKVAYLQDFGIYISHQEIIWPVGAVLKYLIPFGEIGLALLFLVRGYVKVALYTSMIMLMLFVFWIMAVFLFKTTFFWPYQIWWKGMTWMPKMIFSLSLCWMAFMAIIFSKPAEINTKLNTNSLRNRPANAS
jgi:hypothetical protein